MPTALDLPGPSRRIHVEPLRLPATLPAPDNPAPPREPAPAEPPPAEPEPAEPVPA